MKLAVMEVEWLLAVSGRAESVKMARWRPPKDKARYCLARIREADKTGTHIIEVVLAALATIRAVGPRGCPEYVHTTVGKLAKRLSGASGNHKGDDLWTPAPRYARSEGAFIQIVGQKLQDAIRMLLDAGAVEEIVAIAEGSLPNAP